MIVEQFLQWVTTAAPEKRARATHALARAYFISNFNDDDRNAAEAAMTFLLDDPDERVRMALADVLAIRKAAPRHIILGLMEDVEPVSLKIIENSPVLIDSELVDIVAAGESAFQFAVARRKKVSPGVSAAIAEVAPHQVCLRLLENKGAHILPRTLFRLSQRFGYVAGMQQLLLMRDDLPVAGRQLIIATMSETLSKNAVRHSLVEAQDAETASREARERATMTLLRDVESHELPDLVEHLRSTEQLTTVLLLRAICAGQVDFFAEALALLSNVNRSRIFALLNDRSPRILKTVYTKAGLPMEAFPAFSIAFDVYVEEGAVADAQQQYRFTRIMIERILDRYRASGSSDVDEILSMLRRFASETARDAARDYVNSQVDVPRIAAA